MSKSSDCNLTSTIDWGGPFRLYFRLSFWLAVNFLLCAIVGLTVLSRIQISDVDQKLSMRVGNFAGRVAGGLEQVSFDKNIDQAVFSGRQILLTLMSDPAIECAELRDLDGQPILKAPLGLGCYPGVSANSLVVPVQFIDDMDLVLHWRRDEVTTAAIRQRNLSAFVLGSGLIFAVLSNLLAFRKIIGSPLKLLITGIERAKVTAEHNAMHDSLTGLGNRRKLDHELFYRAERKRILTVLNIDLDGFKLINDTMGHDAGDEVLRICAKRLSANSSEEEVLIRTGGDEFVVLLPPGETVEAARERAMQIIKLLNQFIDINGEKCRVEASIGIASRKMEGFKGQAVQVISNADIALIRAKNENKGGFIEFTEEMRAATEKRRSLGEEIKRGLEHGEFIPYYQPQVSALDHTPVGCEALARWQHPEKGILRPGEFVAVAEEVGILHKIDETIFERVLGDLRRWEDAQVDVPRVSVNVSGRRLFSANLIPQLRSQWIPSKKLTFELLESVVFDQTNATLAWNLDCLREMGIELEIDDFGTDRASVTSILAVKPTRIKVARELIQLDNQNGSLSNTLKAMVALGRALQVGLVAEGVETQEHLKLVEQLGFDRIQGYQIARPMSADMLPQWLSKQTQSKAGSEKKRHSLCTPGLCCD
ncbi:EAL domain-containing protein [uncultured Roseovarius sp.]|uniref:putative bifunctional diguanylate cyclase/phosphodiesterase n=1 Tax=uncultured Roseovarius sp. TaxID=293344 RepID=UPI002634A3A1|nr:EAL domain-containing protein [uncultured Roseovarius sp.]